MGMKHKPSLKRIILITLAMLTGIIFAFLLTAYLVIHSYINKMNLVTTSNFEQPEEIDAVQYAYIEKDEVIVTEPEDTEQALPDSSKEEILTLEDDIRSNMEEYSIPIQADQDVLNILLIGSDTRSAGGSGRSDAMILVSVNKRSKKIIVTSLLRDIYLSIPGNKNNRLNTAYSYGGTDLLLDTIEQNFKLKMDRYVSIDFYAFIDIVDAIGGVTLEVTDKEIPVINGYIREINRLTKQEEERDCLSESGLLLLSGKQALGYSRNRYVGNCDFDRTARQRRVLEQIFEKVKTLHITQIMELLDKLLPQVTTNLSEEEVFTLILSLPAMANYQIEQWSIPMDKTYTPMRIRGMAVLGVDFDANINELYRRVYGINNIQ